MPIFYIISFINIDNQKLVEIQAKPIEIQELVKRYNLWTEQTTSIICGNVRLCKLLSNYGSWENVSKNNFSSSKENHKVHVMIRIFFRLGFSLSSVWLFLFFHLALVMYHGFFSFQPYIHICWIFFFLSFAWLCWFSFSSSMGFRIDFFLHVIALYIPLRFLYGECIYIEWDWDLTVRNASQIGSLFVLWFAVRDSS